jgi:hypothetical protein
MRGLLTPHQTHTQLETKAKRIAWSSTNPFEKHHKPNTKRKAANDRNVMTAVVAMISNLVILHRLSV